MKKTKTYEISVIDKTYSKTISDETKFYTSDTALELVFKLKETEYTFESAEIVLLNIDDRSLTTRPVSKVDNDFVYELDDDIIPHYGEWHCQVRFEQGETYVSSPVKFRIENDLSNDRPPQLSDVQSWVSLKRYADSLTEELKQAVLSVEGIEDTFNENESVRQTTFESAEQSRQTTFETNESVRDETFESNETARKTTFTTNEANRTETFNTNEATRQEKETTRQEDETQRASAESSRASAEAQRKIDHANRSAELAGKADKVVLNNLIDNGDFTDELDFWGKTENAILTHENNHAKMLATESVEYIYQPMRILENYKYYLNAKVMSTTPTDEVSIGFSSNAFPLTANITDTINTQVVTLLTTATATISSKALLIDYRTSEWSPLEIYHYMLINLTETFGVGNEPTKEEMDRLIEITGYIDSEYALNNKEMLIYTLALIRRNKNAIIALGGNI